MRPTRAPPDLWGPEAFAARFEATDERKPGGNRASENNIGESSTSKPTPTRKQSQLALLRALYGGRLRR